MTNDTTHSNNTLFTLVIVTRTAIEKAKGMLKISGYINPFGSSQTIFLENKRPVGKLGFRFQGLIPRYTRDTLPDLDIPIFNKKDSDSEPLPQILNGKPYSTRSGENYVIEVPDQTLPKALKNLRKVEKWGMKKGLTKIFDAAEKGQKIAEKYTYKDIANFYHNLDLLMTQYKDLLAKVVMIEAGKPITAAKLEISRGHKQVKNYKKIAEKEAIYMKQPRPIAVENGLLVYVFHEPFGECVDLSSFNFPFNLLFHKEGAQIIGRNGITNKNSEKTPYTAYILTNMINKAGYRPVSLVNLEKEQNFKLVENPVFDIFSFTGGLIGNKLRDASKALKKITELGGRAPYIVCNVSDKENQRIAKDIVTGKFTYSGQTCIATQFAFMTHRKSKALLPEIYRTMKEIAIVGTVQDPKTMVGPMITAEAAQKLQKKVDEAVEAGAQIYGMDESRDRIMHDKPGGNWFKPTIVVIDPKKVNNYTKLRLFTEEVFGPVLVTILTDRPGQAFQIIEANKIGGLQASIAPATKKDIEKARKKVPVTILNVNLPTNNRNDDVLYGGFIPDVSGTGYEGDALEQLKENSRLSIVKITPAEAKARGYSTELIDKSERY